MKPHTVSDINQYVFMPTSVSEREEGEGRTCSDNISVFSMGLLEQAVTCPFGLVGEEWVSVPVHRGHITL